MNKQGKFITINLGERLEMGTGIIVDTKFVKETKEAVFQGMVTAGINELQGDGLAVEVQYQIGMHASGVCVYSALLIGRRPE